MITRNEAALQLADHNARQLRRRQAAERSIVRAIVRALLKAGHGLAIDNGGDEESEDFTSERATLAAMFATDDEHLIVRNRTTRDAIGWVYFVYGNDGWDVMNDYTTNLSPIIEPLESSVIDKWESRLA